MRVLIRHGDVWLLLKEVYTIQRGRRRRGRQRTRSAAPYGMVAESVEKPPVNGMKYSGYVEVPATKVSRFATKMHMAEGNAVIAIEPDGLDSYKAVIYASTKSELERVKRLAESVIASLQVRRGRSIGEEARGEEEEEVEEADEEQEGEE
ncbi:hypothetical protein CF15_06030 [Pyrodictium occultum]|uniref:Uncharacterized protein n=1 Tax=Pyrodictium occultum TaxID=2309 RepID=A0A0V8RW75_PYROC|nr:hypothetical protein [Pyrodictium occultum]KSW12303.1 hypothetical protein CF15_06030 [Pyrodictium occultum]